MGNTQKGLLSRIIDLRNESAHDVIIRETGGVGVDHILEVAKTLPTEQLLRCLAVHGKMATNSQDTILSAGAVEKKGHQRRSGQDKSRQVQRSGGQIPLCNLQGLDSHEHGGSGGSGGGGSGKH